jgi:aspartyl-tRNA(Asn)/glutamyl-tRNA(Gln) amidotransferase subunit A
VSESWLWMSAADLGRGIDAGAIDPRDLAEVYLAAIAAHPDAERVYVRTMPGRARAEADAAAARAQAGVRRGPLDGVPVSWKDLFDTAGTATEAGSRLLEGRTPDRDAALVARGARAGLVSLGKTHMTELAFSGLGINPVTATPPNINDPELAPGGSSSGAAASVALGLAAAAIGSDTGGSVRVPAAWNDLAGLKTSHGALPMAGVVPLCPRFDTLGPLARTVEDAALLWSVLSGGPALDLTGARLDETRLLVLDLSALGETRAEPAAAFAAAVDRLEAAGARIETREAPGLARAFELSPVLFSAEAYAVWGETIEADPERMFPPVRERFRSGRDATAADYLRAWTELDALRAGFRAATAGWDALLVPTTPNLPPHVGGLLADQAAFNRENLLALRNTRIANLMGLCALTLPAGTPSCGISALAPSGAEARLLRLGAAMEAALV